MLLALIVSQAVPIAPPASQVSANCTHSTYATDQLVCSDSALLALDRTLAGLLADRQAARLAGRWLEDQEAWFLRSRRCAFQADHAGCAGEAYRERIAVLSLLGAAPPVATGMCRLAGGTRLGFAMVDRLIVLIDGGRVIGAAAAAGQGWRPFIAYTTSGRVHLLQDLRGSKLARCTAGKA